MTGQSDTITCNLAYPKHKQYNEINEIYTQFGIVRLYSHITHEFRVNLMAPAQSHWANCAIVQFQRDYYEWFGCIETRVH